MPKEPQVKAILTEVKNRIKAARLPLLPNTSLLIGKDPVIPRAI